MENYGPREADWRFPLDTLIQHVLRREKDTLVYREVTIRLVHSNTKAMETATADLVVVLRRPPITRLSRKDHIESLHVIHFVSESRELFTTASGQNQLIYGLSTGLLQKRLIGLEDQFVFGCCIVGRTIESYVASWDKGKPIVYFLDKFHPLTVPGLLQFFLFLCLVKSQIPSYYEKLSNINAEEVELALTNFGPWRARKAHPVPQIADDEGDDDADGALGPGNAPGTSGHGGPSGHRRGNLRDRAGRRGRGRKGPSKMPPPSDRRLRSHDVLQPGRMGGHIIDEDFVWVGTVSKWRDDAARAISHYGPPASLTESSVAELPQALNPHLIVGPGGKDDFEEISE
ncbi:hypothetical protein BS47DRAFT_1379643 [Hydnum rufescens UP504]|uniref:Uncharacterized protein n=1 Tax=Hydnum rufescens UP504 TaxID=1448309 RepID=A0A9P6B6Z0_9AGAM|nr:hypothetical protein BS47DRAFT_1379643 [Hydnum rufescens UP504]